MKFIVKNIETLADYAGITPAVTAGIRRMMITAIWQAVAAGGGYLTAHLADLNLPVWATIAVGLLAQGIDKWRREKIK